MKSYLIDSSAWILGFSSSPPPRLVPLLRGGLQEDQIFTCGIVMAEILQGCRPGKEREKMKEYFGALPYLRWMEPDWVTLGETSSNLRSLGLTVPVADVMIALLASRHRFVLVHRDRHFDLMARELKLQLERV